jgi:hypothetical protein
LFWRAPAHWARKYFGEGLSLEESSVEEVIESESSTEVDDQYSSSSDPSDSDGESKTESSEEFASIESDGEDDENMDSDLLGDEAGSPEEVYLFYLNALSKYTGTLLNNFEFFLYGADTSQCEAFHFVCNGHYAKGTTCSFDQYVMKKTHAAFDWIETQRCKYEGLLFMAWLFFILLLGREISFPQVWEIELLSEFTESLTAQFSPTEKNKSTTKSTTTVPKKRKY